MVLDEILYSKTPWEISSLGRMLPKKKNSHLSMGHFLELQMLATAIIDPELFVFFLFCLV